MTLKMLPGDIHNRKKSSDKEFLGYRVLQHLGYCRAIIRMGLGISSVKLRGLGKRQVS
jgi:hypothetical protein